jgi:N-acetylmuramoyl-L-alanine amidase
MAFARPSQAQQLAFTVEGSGQRVETALLDVEGVPYVSLTALFAQLGGTVADEDTGVSFSLAGKTAKGRVNSARVETPERIMTLRRPLLRHASGVIAAQEDGAAFFRQLFGVALQEEMAPPPAPVAAAPPGEPDPAGELAAAAIPQAPSAPAPAALGAMDTIIIDPGHGGADAGMAGAGGLVEKTFTLDVARELKRVLNEKGLAKVYLTREDDTELSFRERANFAAQQQGDLLISLHAGASYSPQAHGIDVFHAPPPPGSGPGLGRRAAAGRPADYSAASRAAAEAIAAAVQEASQTTLRGIHEAPIRLLAEAGMPGVLIELGCLTNSAEEGLMQSKSYQAQLAAGIAQGVLAIAGGARR